jgi:hypothetical protein
MRARAAGALLFCAVLANASLVRADVEYTDEDSEYLKVTSFFLEPVGQILEWTVFRPIHFVHHLINPSDPWDPEYRVYGGPKGVCTGLRPRRECGMTQ